MNLIFRFPFDYRTPFGYIAAFIIQYVSGFFAINIFILLMSFIIGTYWMIVSVVKDIQVCLFKVQPDKSEWELLIRLSEIIQLNLEAKQLNKFLVNFQ